MPRSASALFHVEEEVPANLAFRRVVWTGTHAQMVYMSLEPDETIDMEVHPNVDQFFRIEEGDVIVTGANNTKMFYAFAGDAFFIAAGTLHMIQAGRGGAKLYTIYSPPNHPWNRVQLTKPTRSHESSDVGDEAETIKTVTLMRALGRIV